ncbi:uncharacterized protein [Apostichopus japonicus]|uniref:uncharacterized protein isoform X1 n=1 Tax=Stichopus japonicus TaxID=307972 RepID=UPI003AB1525F
MVHGNLIANRINVSRDRIRESMKRVDSAGVEFRRKISLHRRVYSVPDPNYFKHIDGNHKVLRWRLVIHGGIDGYSRMPVFYNCANNNKAQTMFVMHSRWVSSSSGYQSKYDRTRAGGNVLGCSFMLHHPLQGGVSTTNELNDVGGICLQDASVHFITYSAKWKTQRFFRVTKRWIWQRFISYFCQ